VNSTVFVVVVAAAATAVAVAVVDDVVLVRTVTLPTLIL